MPPQRTMYGLTSITADTPTFGPGVYWSPSTTLHEETLSADLEQILDRWNAIETYFGETNTEWSGELGSPTDYEYPHMRVLHPTLGETYLPDVITDFRDRNGLDPFTFPDWFPGTAAEQLTKAAIDLRAALLLRQMVGRRASYQHNCLVNGNGVLWRRSARFMEGYPSNPTNNGFAKFGTNDVIPFEGTTIALPSSASGKLYFNTDIYSVEALHPLERENDGAIVPGTRSGDILGSISTLTNGFSTSYYTPEIRTSDTFPTTVADLEAGAVGQGGKYVWFWVPDVLTKIADLVAEGQPNDTFMYWQYNLTKPSGADDYLYWTEYAQPLTLWPTNNAWTYPLDEQYADTDLN